MVVAYLRVSTEKQFLANQREELLRFAEKNGLQIDKWYTETVSGSVRSKDRKLSGVLNFTFFIIDVYLSTVSNLNCVGVMSPSFLAHIDILTCMVVPSSSANRSMPSISSAL